MSMMDWQNHLERDLDDPVVVEVHVLQMNSVDLSVLVVYELYSDWPNEHHKNFDRNSAFPNYYLDNHRKLVSNSFYSMNC